MSRLIFLLLTAFVPIKPIECRPNSRTITTEPIITTIVAGEDELEKQPETNLTALINRDNNVQQVEELDNRTVKMGKRDSSVLMAKSEPERLAESFGYQCETHEVTTEDGYVLTLHRIPRGKKSKKGKEKRPVALLLHGFLASSDSWLFRGPDKDLPYIFAEEGYDVWVCNLRGNVFSRKHLRLDPDEDGAFWNFSIHEHGIYDLPASIDYILNATKQPSLFFLGHSIGATAFFIMCSLRPDYNSKIKLAHALAPAAIISHPVPPFTQFLLSLIPPVMMILKRNGVLEVFPQRQVFTRIGKSLCNDGAMTQPLCLLLMFSAVGADYEQFNHTMFPQALTYYPAGTSVDVVLNVHEIFTGTFQPPNANKTNSAYNLSLVTAPVALHYGDGDALVTREDNEILASKLSNPIGIFRVPYKNFNHIDFMWSIDSKILLYDHLMDLMYKYK